MVACEGHPDLLAAKERLIQQLNQQRNRCQEIFARQEERLRLVQQGLGQYFENLHAQLKELSERPPVEKAGVKTDVWLPVLESAIQAIQQNSDLLRQQKAFGEQPLSAIAAELIAVKNELAGLSAIKQDLERQIAGLQSQRRGDESQWREREAQLLAEFEEEKRHWMAQWKERETALNALVMRCTQLEEEIEALRQSNTAADGSEYKERYNLAVAEIRELRQRNAELEKKVSQLEQSKGQPGGVASDGRILDWEAEKRRILAALEAEAASSQDPESSAERTRIQEIIQKTETLLAEKDQEIAELRRLLEQQATSIGSMAVGAAALERMLDQDEIIRQQREHLRQLEDEWKEKLRKAELEISLERAKIAREKALLEEKQRELQERLEQLEKASAPGDRGKTQPQRGRWLSRLGLNGAPET